MKKVHTCTPCHAWNCSYCAHAFARQQHVLLHRSPFQSEARCASIKLRRPPNWLEVKDALVNIVQSPTDCKCNICTIMLGVTDTDRTKKQQPSSKQWENYLWRTYKSNLSSNTYKQLLTLQLWIIFLMIFRINHYNAMDKTEV